MPLVIETEYPVRLDFYVRPVHFVGLSQDRFEEFFEEVRRLRRQRQAAVIDLISDDDDGILIKDDDSNDDSDIVCLDSPLQSASGARARSPRRGHARPRSPSPVPHRDSTRH